MQPIDNQQNSLIKDLESTFIQQQDCFSREPYSSVKSRAHALQALHDCILEHQGKICQAINLDFGNRPEYETKVLEIFPALEAIKYAKKYLNKWVKPRSQKISKWFIPSKCWLQPQAKGVVGIVLPWNYPLLLAIAPLVAALAAGNRVMIKTSEYTPNTANLLKTIFATKFVDSKLAVITGGPSIAAKFTALPFDHLLFTGSTAIGKIVAESAAKNLTPVTLELGGKSPVILVEDELEQAYIDRIWLGKILNAGQTCIAPDYIWLPQNHNEKLWELSNKVISKRFTDLNSEDYCSIINKANYQRIIKLVEDAISKGASWRPFTERWHTDENNIYKIAPGLLFNVNHNMEIMQEEIFGPVMPVMQYDRFDELQLIMQVVPKPLATYLFTKDKKKQEIFLNKTRSGALTLNNTIVHAAQESLPFGGIGASGMGCYRGQHGFDTFSHLKPVYRQSFLDIFSRFYPPVNKWQRYLLKLMIR